MTPIEFITTVLASAGGAGLTIAGLAAWLGKIWADRITEAEKGRVTREIEILKASLEAQQLRFSLLHTKRAEILSELYEHLVNAFNHTFAMAGKVERDLSIATESAKAAHKAVGAALALLQTRKIWLSKELAERVEKLLVGGLLNPALTYHYYTKEKLSDGDVIRSVELWNERKAEVRQLLVDIEHEFRSLLTSVEGTQR